MPRLPLRLLPAAATPYLAVYATRFRALLQYRTAALAGLATQFFWGLIRMMIFVAFYRSATDATDIPMPLADTITYVWLGQATLLVMPWNVDRDVNEMIRSGAVGYELVRPIDLHGMWYARALAMRTAPVMLRFVPMMAVVGWIGWLQPPPTMAAGLAFGASILSAALLSAAITVFLNVTMFWTVSGEGIIRLAPGVLILCSGLIIPLPMFPAPVTAVLEWLPFAGLMDVPFRLYTGLIPASDAWWQIARQLVWTGAIVIAGRWLLSRGVRRTVMQGG
ncbi:MAG: ABC transporter permease [Planctomycetota bacterium]